jgi:hypothetical protein
VERLQTFGSIVGIAVGVVTLTQHIRACYPPNLDVNGAAFIHVSDPKKLPVAAPEGWPTQWLDDAIYVLVDVQADDRPVSVSGLDIAGDLFLNVSEYVGFGDDIAGRTIPELSQELKTKRPYFRVSWLANLNNSNAPIQLEAHEQRLLVFTLMESSLFAYPFSYVSPLNDYIGFADGTKRPKRKIPYPSIPYVFELASVGSKGPMRPRKLRRDFFNGNVRLSIRAGGKSGVKVPAGDSLRFRSVPIEHWKRNGPGQIYNEVSKATPHTASK